MTDEPLDPTCHNLPPLSALKPLSGADRDLFLAALDGPPPEPTDSLKRAMAAQTVRSTASGAKS